MVDSTLDRLAPSGDEGSGRAGSRHRADGDRLSLGDEAGTPPEDRRFRPDVQGLRAVAVAVVVLFHAHVPGFGGGYVGVDVFFVISGYVITGLLLRERTTTGATSIMSFYARRARRIIPAATLVILVAVVAAYVALGPVAGNRNADDARWASVFLLNVHFAHVGTNYLASQAPPSVLQNFWSLAVEEQFYVVYPTLFLVAVRARWATLRQRVAVLLVAAAVASFAVSVVQTSGNPTAAYFSPFTRAWELALGGIVAVGAGALRRLPRAVAAGLTWIGLAGVVVASTSFSSSTPYPGWAVALPVVGTALTIAGGTAEPRWGAERVLRHRLLQWLGLVSYSLYLWHWPLLTLAAERGGTTRLPVADSLWWVAVALLLSVVTYRLVENPLRHHTRLAASRRMSLAMGASLVAVSLVVASTALQLHPQPNTSVSNLATLNPGAFCPQPSAHELRALEGTSATEHPPIRTRVLLVGDSTACALLPGLEAVGRPAGVQVEDATVIGCGVVSGGVTPPAGSSGAGADRSCAAKAALARRRALAAGQPAVVLWASTWERDAVVTGPPSRRRVLEPGSPAWKAALTERMTQFVRPFTGRGADVVMLTQAPFSVYRDGPGVQNFNDLNAVIEDFAARTPHVAVVDLASRVCPSGPPCPYRVDGVFVRGDGTHFTSAGALWVARWLMPQLHLSAPIRPAAGLPIMRISRPHPGAVLTGTVLVNATAAYGFGFAGVDFQLDVAGRWRTVARAASWHYGWGAYWDTRSVPDGSYALRTVVVGRGSARSIGPSVHVRIAN